MRHAAIADHSGDKLGIHPGAPSVEQSKPPNIGRELGLVLLRAAAQLRFSSLGGDSAGMMASVVGSIFEPYSRQDRDPTGTEGGTDAPGHI
ncbi:MAG: hypothetical protein KHY90_10215 [Clostridium sp.]|nr:hypothetical protein [Clostridium sp.]